LELFECFARELFDGFNSSGLRWCVLRNYEGLPFRNVGHDIDINVDGGWSPQVEDIIANVCRNTKTIVQRINYIQHHPCRGYVFTKTSHDDTPWYLQVDIHGGEDLWGMPIIRQHELLNHRQKYNDCIWIPHPVHEAMIKWLVTILSGGILKQKYESQILAAFNEESSLFRAFLIDIMGGRVANHVVDLLRLGKIQETKVLRKKIIQRLFLRRIFECPTHVLAGFAKSLHYILTRRLFPPGIWAVLIFDDESRSKIDTEGIMSLIQKAFLADTTKYLKIKQVKSKNYLAMVYNHWKTFFSEIHKRTNRFGCVVTDNCPPYGLAMNAQLPLSVLKVMPKPGVAVFIHGDTMSSEMEALKNTLAKMSFPVISIPSGNIETSALTVEVMHAISAAKHREFLKQKKLPTFKTTL
jgi:hypothetical protein